MKSSYLKSILPFMLAMDIMNQGSNIKDTTDVKHLDLSPKEAPMPKGMHKWIIDGKTVYAATKKAAIKKASKQSN